MADQQPPAQQQLRVGIFGAANIARKVWGALHGAGHVVTIVGTRDTAKGVAFAESVVAELNGASSSSSSPVPVPRVGSYKDVVDADDVDVVYVPIPVTSRDEWVRAAMRRGKHIVGEKPPARSVAELREWLDLAAAEGVLYMDGTMFSHGQRLARVKEAIAAVGGPIAHIDVQMSFYPSDESFFEKDIRMFPALEPHGALGDVGWYYLRWILHLLDGFEAAAKPEGSSGITVTRAVTTKRCEKTGAIVAFEADITFAVGGSTPTTTATFFCSMAKDLPHLTRAYVRDSNGSNCTLVTIPDCVVPANDAAPYYLVERAIAAAASSCNAADEAKKGAVCCFDGQRLSAEGLTAYEAKAGVERFVAGGDEADGTFQTIQMWRNVAAALMPANASSTSSAVERPRRADPAVAAVYASRALGTQSLMETVFDAEHKQ